MSKEKNILKAILEEAKAISKDTPSGLKWLLGFMVVLGAFSLSMQYRITTVQSVYQQNAYDQIDNADKTGKTVTYFEVDEAMLDAETENDIIKHAVDKGWLPTYKGQRGITVVKVK